MDHNRERVHVSCELPDGTRRMVVLASIHLAEQSQAACNSRPLAFRSSERLAGSPCRAVRSRPLRFVRQTRSTQCAAIVSAEMWNSRLKEAASNFISAIVRSAEGKAVLRPTLRRSWQTLNFGGFAAPNSFPLGGKTLDFVLTLVPLAGHPCPIRWGTRLTSGFLLAYLRMAINSKLFPTCVSLRGRRGTPFRFKVCAMTMCPICPSSSPCCVLLTPNR